MCFREQVPDHEELQTQLPQLLTLSSLALFLKQVGVDPLPGLSNFPL